MITCDFEKRGASGLSEYLYSSIKNQIIDGTLSADTRLPSKRALAEHLGVSVITVQNAYWQLISEGYIYSFERKGFFVTDISCGYSAAHDAGSDLGGEAEFQQKNSADVISGDKISHEYFADFRSSATSFEKFPFSLWSRVMRSVLHQSDESLLKSPPSAGVPEIRESIAAYLRSFRNMEVSPEQIVIGAGTESIYSMIVQLLGRDKLYAVENPGYRKIFSVLELNGARCVPVSIDSQGIMPEQLEASGASIAHVSPLHHFPTGIVIPVRRRRELLSWVLQSDGRYIIEDDYDSEFRFTGKPLQTLQSADKGGRVIYVNTFSKTLSPSYRISYMVLPLQLAAVFRKKLEVCACPVSVFEQYALAEFMRRGYYEKHIIRMKNYYRTLRNNLISALEASPIADMAQIHEKDAGLHFLLNVNFSASGRELQNRLQSQDINIPLLSDFFYQPASDSTFFDGADRTFVLNYSGIKKERISEAVRRIVSAFTL